MDANELRIGNWLLVDEDGPYVPMQLEFVGKNVNGFKGYSAHFKGRTVTLEDIYNDGDLNVKPIPLTPEILIKCGFEPVEEKHGFPYQYIGKDWCMEYDGDGVIGFTHDDYDNEVQVYIKSLHQLQNLYWCLCGKELEVNLQ